MGSFNECKEHAKKNGGSSEQRKLSNEMQALELNALTCYHEKPWGDLGDKDIHAKLLIGYEARQGKWCSC